MAITNSEITNQARESLSGKWGLAIGTFAIYALIVVAMQAIPKTGGLISLIVSGPLSLGIIIFSLSLSRNTNPHLEQMFYGFKRFKDALVAYLLTTLFTMLWALLLLVPGIVAALSYTMTFYIMADDESISARDAIKKSKKMMNGYKWKMFCLDLRFLGWAILCIFTLGIGFIWLIPYMSVATAKFYEDIKGGVELAEVKA
jgi:uncharacterized membrane protein